MTWVDGISLVSSLVSLFLAVFAIWLANEQRKESSESYEKTKDALANVDKATEKIEVLVSSNFTDLLKSNVDGQKQMLNTLALMTQPKLSPEEMFMKAIIDKPDEQATRNLMDAYKEFQKAGKGD